MHVNGPNYGLIKDRKVRLGRELRPLINAIVRAGPPVISARPNNLCRLQLPFRRDVIRKPRRRVILKRLKANLAVLKHLPTVLHPHP